MPIHLTLLSLPDDHFSWGTSYLVLWLCYSPIWMLINNWWLLSGWEGGASCRWESTGCCSWGTPTSRELGYWCWAYTRLGCWVCSPSRCYYNWCCSSTSSGRIRWWLVSHSTHRGLVCRCSRWRPVGRWCHRELGLSLDSSSHPHMLKCHVLLHVFTIGSSCKQIKLWKTLMNAILIVHKILEMSLTNTRAGTFHEWMKLESHRLYFQCSKFLSPNQRSISKLFSLGTDNHTKQEKIISQYIGISLPYIKTLVLLCFVS